MNKTRRFTAAFESECNGCFADIWEGDEAGYVDDEVCCESCCDNHDNEVDDLNPT